MAYWFMIPDHLIFVFCILFFVIIIQAIIISKLLKYVLRKNDKSADATIEWLRGWWLELEILQNIFASGEDGVLVEKELMNLIKGKIDETHPLWDYVKDKGGDVIVAGMTAKLPILYYVFREYLLSRGINLF